MKQSDSPDKKKKKTSMAEDPESTSQDDSKSTLFLSSSGLIPGEPRTPGGVQEPRRTVRYAVRDSKFSEDFTEIMERGAAMARKDNVNIEAAFDSCDFGQGRVQTTKIIPLAIDVTPPRFSPRLILCYYRFLHFLSFDWLIGFVRMLGNLSIEAITTILWSLLGLFIAFLFWWNWENVVPAYKSIWDHTLGLIFY